MKRESPPFSQPPPSTSPNKNSIEEALRRQALVFENMYDGVIITDTNGRICGWNPAAERIFKYSFDQIVGKSPEILNPPLAAAKLSAEIDEEIRRHGRWSGPVHYLCSDVGEGICEAVVVPFRDQAGRELGRIAG